MKVSLVVLTPGKSEGQAIPITLSQFLIGRDPQCQLRPASGSISKRHCAILVRGAKVFVRDLESTNGTFVNDQQVKGEVEVQDKDKIKLGPLLFGIAIEAKKAVAKETVAVVKETVSAPAAKPAASAPAKQAGASSPAKPGDAVDDEDVAAWLLSLQDEGATGSADTQEVPDGNTAVIEQPPGIATTTPLDPAEKAARERAEAEKAAAANTSDVARAILQKYMRRPRG